MVMEKKHITYWNLIKKPLAHGAIYVSGTAISGIVSLITFPILARLVSVSGMGEYDFFLFLLMIAVPFTTIGIEYGFGAFAHELSLSETNSLLKKIIPFSVTSAMLLSSLIFTLKIINIFQTFSYKLILLWAFSLIAISFCTILKSLMIWRQHPIKAAIIINGEWILASILGIFLVLFLGHKIDNYLIGLSIAFAVSSFMSFKLWPKSTAHTDSHIHLKQILEISWPYGITNMLFLISLGIEKAIILKALGPYALGIYAMANKVGTIPQLIGLNFIMGWIPEIIKSPDSKKIYKTLWLIMFIYGVCAIMISFLFRTPIIGFFGGEKYSESVNLLPIATIASVIGLIPWTINAILLKRKQTLPILYYSIISSLITIALSPVLISKYEIMGAIYAVITGRVIGSIGFIYKIKKHRK